MVGKGKKNIRTHLIIKQMIVTKTLFSIPALLTFVPASINHLRSICVPRQCTALMPCVLLRSGNVYCAHGLRSRWKVHLLLAQCYSSLHAGAFSLFREVCLDAFCSQFYCSFKNKIKEFQQDVVQDLANTFSRWNVSSVTQFYTLPYSIKGKPIAATL